MELKEIFTKAERLYQDMVEADKKLNSILEANIQKSQELAERELVVADIESAKTALAEARKLTLALEQKQNDVDAARADFNNWERERRAGIAKEVTALQVLKDREAELLRDKDAFQLRVAELEKEKLEYRKRIKAELVEHFKNTKGNGVA